MTSKALLKRQILHQVEYLNEHAGELSESDLTWAIKMEEAFRRFGELTERQHKILEDIYKRY